MLYARTQTTPSSSNTVEGGVVVSKLLLHLEQMRLSWGSFCELAMIVTITETYQSAEPLEHEPQRYQIDLSKHHEPITLGRAQYCNHVLMHGDIRVSRIQATLSPENGEWYLHDGGLHPDYGPSKSGIFLSGEKLKAKVRLKPGIEASLFRSPIGAVDLLVEKELIYSGDPPTDAGDAVLALRREIAELHREVIRRDAGCEQRLIELKQEFEQLKAKDHSREALFAKMEMELNSLMELFNQRFDQLSRQISGTETELDLNRRHDSHRDKRIQATELRQRRTIAVLAISLVACGGWIVTGGNLEVLNRYLPWAASAIGLGAVGQIAGQEVTKSRPKS